MPILSLKFIKNVFISLISVTFISLFKISPLPNYLLDYFKKILNYPYFEDSSLIFIILTIILSLVEAIKYVFSEKLVLSLEMRISDLLNPTPSDQGSHTNLGNSISGSAEGTQNNPISVPNSPTPSEITQGNRSGNTQNNPVNVPSSPSPVDNTQNSPISVPSSPTPADNTDGGSSSDSEGISRRFPKHGDNFYFFFT